MTQIEENKDPKTYAIIGAAMEVHKQLGCGFLETVYQEALEEEFLRHDIPFVRETNLDIFYKGKKLNTTYRADFICFNEVIVELKALDKISSIETAQMLNYLRISNLKIGLILNFGSNSLGIERKINKSEKSV